MKGLLVFLIVFGLLVFVHEFGHFIVAKKAGIRVREFSIGMGPKLFQVHRATTTYTIRWLPLGGYVRLAGSDDAASLDPGAGVVLKLVAGKVTKIDASESALPMAGVPLRVVKADLVDQLQISGYVNDDESVLKTYPVDHDATIIDQTHTELIIAPRDTQFQAAKVWQKLGTNVAGPLMNILLGFVVLILWSVLSAGPQTTTIKQTQPDMPSHRVLQAGDVVTKVNGHQISSFADLQTRIAATRGRQVKLAYRRGQQQKSTTLRPVKKAGTYLIGIETTSDNRIGVKLTRGLQLGVSVSGMIFRAVGNLLQHFNLNKLSGPVGIYSQTAKVSNLGFDYVLLFLGMISINLGIVNLIPIPGLDGGKLLLNLIELVRGKPISPEHETIVELAGVVLLLILIIAITGNDIYRYFLK